MPDSTVAAGILPAVEPGFQPGGKKRAHTRKRASGKPGKISGKAMF
jgi:hypothetical protein